MTLGKFCARNWDKDRFGYWITFPHQCPPVWPRSHRPQGAPAQTSFSPSCTEAALCLVRGLQNVDVFAGEVATFSCEVSRAGGPEARWWLDGTLLQNSPESVITVQEGTVHSLMLSGLGVADSGTITFRTGPLVSTAKLLVKGIGQGGPPHAGASALAVPACFLQGPRGLNSVRY